MVSIHECTIYEERKIMHIKEDTWDDKNIIIKELSHLSKHRAVKTPTPISYKSMNKRPLKIHDTYLIPKMMAYKYVAPKNSSSALLFIKIHRVTSFNG